MKEWILSIGFSVLLVSIISIILPDGKVGKYVKSIFSVLILFIMLKPILSDKVFDFNDFVYQEQDNIMYQENYLNYVFEEQKLAIEKNCIEIIENKGICQAKVNIEYEIADFTLKLSKIKINLKNAVINSDKEHIYVIDSLKKDIIEYLSIDQAQLEIYE